MKRLLGLAVTIAMMASLFAFAGTSAQDATPGTFPIKIKFLNAMTAQKEIDVFINGSDSDQRVVEGLDYGTFSDQFDGTSPATEVIVKRNVNMGFDQWLFDTVIPTQPGQSYVVVISDFMIIPVQVDLSAANVGARGSIVHAASQAPALDVLVNDEVRVTNIRYGQASDAGLAAAGTYNVVLNQTGTTNVALQQDGVVVDAGKAYTYVVIGEPGSTEEPLILVVDSQDLQAA